MNGDRHALSWLILAGRWWPWGVVTIIAAFIHLGTAVLRLNSFWPSPQLVDFAAYYAAGWSLRLGQVSNQWQPEFIDWLRQNQGVSTAIPSLNSPPLWAWLLQPLTYFPFPQASLIWLAILTTLIAVCTYWLASCARLGPMRWQAWLLLGGLVISFGPSFLNLTLGQNGFFLLAAALLLGQAIEIGRRGERLAAALGAALATAAKLFPLLWIGTLLLLPRRQLFLLSLLPVLIGMAAMAVLHPGQNVEYWAEFLPGRGRAFSESASLDDRSMLAWLNRLGRPHRFQVVGLSPSTARTVTWTFPWSFSPRSLTIAAYAILAAIGLSLLGLRLKLNPGDAAGYFFLWILFGLLLVPHIARYNHVLLLPAMAWLWRHRRLRSVALVYLLAGLSRLNHLWSLLLPAPWGPLATGFGLIAVLVAGSGIIRQLLETE